MDIQFSFDIGIVLVIATTFIGWFVKTIIEKKQEQIRNRNQHIVSSNFVLFTNYFEITKTILNLQPANEISKLVDSLKVDLRKTVYSLAMYGTTKDIQTIIPIINKMLTNNNDLATFQSDYCELIHYMLLLIQDEKNVKITEQIFPIFTLTKRNS